MLDYVEFLGAPAQDEPAELGLTAGDWRHAHSHLDRLAHPLIGLHPAARSNTRRWALERFAAAGAQLQRQFGGTLVGLGEAAEEETVITVLESAGVPSVNLAGCTSLPVLAAVIASLDVLVTNDTGPAHLAYSFGTPTVVIFGSADPERYLPPGDGTYRPLIYPVPCRPCGLEICPIGYTCLNGIRVEDVVRSAEELLTRRPQSPRASGLPDP
jgi:ADP-heptose:LPS heptosyltransferase